MRAMFLAGLAVGAALVLATSQASAATGYHAVPERAQTARLVSSELAWTCDAAGCSAPRTGASRDSHICSRLARDVGPLSAFTVGNIPFDEQALARCNQAGR